MTEINAKLLIDEISKPVSQIALGTAFYRIENKEKWFGILDDYINAGGTVIDTGRAYSTSEEVLGLWMEKRSVREKTVILTKCGLTAHGVLPSDNFPKVVSRELTESLQALRTDYIDVYLLHRDNPDMSVGEILTPLNQAIDNGQVKAIGASNWEYPRLTEANEYADKHNMKGFSVVSNNLSLALPTGSFYPGLVSVDKVGERWHSETGIPLIPWSSQARGFFTGRFTSDSSNSQEIDSFTARMRVFYSTDENLEKLRRTTKLGEKKGEYTATEVALAWLLHKPFPIVPIVGPHTQEELASCIKATSLSLTETEIKWLNLEE